MRHRSKQRGRAPFLAFSLVTLAFGGVLSARLFRIAGGPEALSFTAIGVAGALAGLTALTFPGWLRRRDHWLLLFPLLGAVASVVHVALSGPVLADLYRALAAPPGADALAAHHRARLQLTGVAFGFFVTGLHGHLWIGVTAALALFALAGRATLEDGPPSKTPIRRLVLLEGLALLPPLLLLGTAIYYHTTSYPFGRAVAVVLGEVVGSRTLVSYLLLLVLLLSCFLQLNVIALLRLHQGPVVEGARFQPAVLSAPAMLIAVLSAALLLSGMLGAQIAGRLLPLYPDTTQDVLAGPFFIRTLTETAYLWLTPVYWCLVAAGVSLSIYALWRMTARRWALGLPLLVAGLLVAPDALLGARLNALPEPSRDERCDNLDEWILLLQRRTLATPMHLLDDLDGLVVAEALDLPESTADGRLWDVTTVVVTKKHLLFNGRKLSGIRDGRIVNNASDRAPLLPALYDGLREERRRYQGLGESAVNNEFLLAMDRSTRIQTLHRVLLTARKAGYTTVNLATKDDTPHFDGYPRCPRVSGVSAQLNPR